MLEDSARCNAHLHASFFKAGRFNIVPCLRSLLPLGQNIQSCKCLRHLRSVESLSNEAPSFSFCAIKQEHPPQD
jgi:hypothetical protein